VREQDADCRQCRQKSRDTEPVPPPDIVIPGAEWQKQSLDSLERSSSEPTVADRTKLHSLGLGNGWTLPKQGLGTQTILSPETATDQLESLETPVALGDGEHTLLTSDIAGRMQVLEVTPEPAAMSLDDIREEQTADDCLQPVIKALDDCVQLPHSDLHQYPEETRILLSQWDSLVL